MSLVNNQTEQKKYFCNSLYFLLVLYIQTSTQRYICKGTVNITLYNLYSLVGNWAAIIIPSFPFLSLLFTLQRKSWIYCMDMDFKKPRSAKRIQVVEQSCHQWHYSYLKSYNCLATKRARDNQQEMFWGSWCVEEAKEAYDYFSEN